MLRRAFHVLIAAAAASAQSGFLTLADLRKLPADPPAARIRYGGGDAQYGELRLPSGRGPYPVAVVIHGGCWGEFADASIMGNFASHLTRAGLATWNIEYRHVHQEGGGWPGTFLDVAHAVDHLRAIANEHRLDLQRVAAVGHSAGGHLALWAAARRKIPASSPLHVASPLALRGAVSLGGIPDLEPFLDYGRKPCGDRPTRLMGGPPAEHSDRYAVGSAAPLLPLGVPHHLIWGAADRTVPREPFLAYEESARRKGDSVTVTVLQRSAHFDMLSPDTENWAAVLAAVRSMAGVR